VEERERERERERARERERDAHRDTERKREHWKRVLVECHTPFMEINTSKSTNE